MRKSRSDQLTDWLCGQKKNGKKREMNRVGIFCLKSFFSFGEEEVKVK